MRCPWSTQRWDPKRGPMISLTKLKNQSLATATLLLDCNGSTAKYDESVEWSTGQPRRWQETANMSGTMVKMKPHGRWICVSQNRNQHLLCRQFRPPTRRRTLCTECWDAPPTWCTSRRRLDKRRIIPTRTGLISTRWLTTTSFKFKKKK